MATKIGMCSNALLLLGDRPISSFSDNTAGAQVMANLYENTYRDLCTAQPWSFARKQLQLSQNVTDPVFDSYQYSYNLPNDYLAAIGLRDGGEYRIYAGGLLYTNVSPAEFEYIARPSEGTLPPYFEKLVTDTLAARAASAVTDRTSMIDMMAAQAQDQLLRAMAIDAQNDTNRAIYSSPFTECR